MRNDARYNNFNLQSRQKFDSKRSSKGIVKIYFEVMYALLPVKMTGY